MTARIDRLLAVLDAAGVRLTPAELAEAVWLALRVDVTGGMRSPTVDAPAQPASDSMPGPAPARPGGPDRVDLRLPVPEGAGGRPVSAEPVREDEGGPAGPRVSETTRKGPRTAPGADRSDGAVTDEPGLEAVPGWPLLVRAASALPESGRILRALRPLKRRVRSGHRTMIDEEATACQIAERRLWTPVWRPATDRWLHLLLVLDRSSVGGIWNRLGHEVRTLLERLGAFRTIRVAYLGLRDDGAMGVMGPSRPRRLGRTPTGSPLRLAGGPGDQLILVLSDCVSDPWHDGAMSRVLGHWAHRAPVAIIQPLPERLWGRTGLDPVPGRLSVRNAGAPSVVYDFTSAWRRRGLPECAGPVPVLEIDPRWLRPWANLVAGRAVGGIDAIVVPAGEHATDAPGHPAAVREPDDTARPPIEPAADRLVREFRAGSSTLAYQLARYLSAAVPLNLGVMRVVQAVMVPRARSSHLAEVLYGGLLVPLSSDGPTADEQHFEFRPGVRQVLMGTLPQAEAGRVLAEVSSFVERHLERTGASFTAVVSAPVGGLTVPALRQPFAQIRAEVLRRLAGSAAPTDVGVAGPGSLVGPPLRRTRSGASDAGAARLTILHLTGLGSAGEDGSGSPGRVGASGAEGSGSGPRFDRSLPDEAAAMCHRNRMTPDLVVVTGGVASRATPAEYQAAYRSLETLRAQLGLPAGRMIVVPGLSDVNEGRCLAHFLDRAADGEEPVPPYWPKWEPFTELTARLPGATAFQPETPWQLMPIPAARTVIAGLNSTVAVSHLPGERFGQLGQAQLRWFADRLRDYERRGWLRVGVLCHDPTDGTGDTGLRDADAFTRLLAPRLDVVLHGGGGGVREIGLTGVPAIGLLVGGGPVAPGVTGRVGSGHQVVDLRPGRLDVLPHDAGRRWSDPTRRALSHAYGDHWWPPESGDQVVDEVGGVGADDDLSGTRRTDLVARVARAYRARTPGAAIAEHPWPGAQTGGARAGYLVVAPADDGRSAPYRVGVFDGEPRTETVRRFLDDVVRPGGQNRDATLVCRSAPTDSGLRERALGQGVRLVGFADFELGDDVLRYTERQAATLADDPAFPADRYVPQSYVLFDPDAGSSRDADTVPAEPAPELLSRLRHWLAVPEGQMIAVLGASGAGKTFLLRELARRLHADRDSTVPILVDLRSLDWRVGLDELVAIHLSRGGLRRMDLDRSRYLLREGRVVLLCDGLDDLAARATHNRLRDWVAGWEAGARIRPGRGKVVLVSRDADLLVDAVGPYRVDGAAGPTLHWVRLMGLDRDRILEFLTRRLGDRERARLRLALLEQVGGLARMARNPRMLAFIADIDEQRLREAASGDGPVTVAALYQRLISEWLDGERRSGGTDDTLGRTSSDDVERAVTYLARRLWESGETALGADALGAAADILTRLTNARGRGVSGRSAAAHLLGARTLLVRDPAYRFHFVDHSVLEWLIAREIADQMDPDAPARRVRGLLRREMSPLLVEFLCDLAGHGTARGWARMALADPGAPDEVRAGARRVLAHLDRSGSGGRGPDPNVTVDSPEPPAGRDRP